ncbi:T9SS type B sorting domain-containing protein [Winogradskyella sediminis]|uniref:Gliding motility-associated C-terminal domain-containing protein n=1 Tax=Winogradskyella sediminis TaxID=1382466 RepID=A0A1H1MMY7_9FLAO|nr:T9SS type B sorting domain-containing protein [Winogradskyella sediminis]SDR87329.1 gliding motility-associated C-terminal domain-containing protein [Winogradskyella sediminis]
MNRYLILLIFNVFFYQINAQEPNDCVNAITVCGNGTFISNATGSGNDFEINACGGFEHNSLWLEVNIVQSGTLGFDLIPIDPDIMVDYDFWVFGPNRLCSNLGSPIRCATTNPNAAGLPNNYTGINGSTTLTQSGPGANGNGYVYWLDVNVGESYFIVIDRPEGDGGFEIQWTGTATEGSGAFPAPPTVNEIDDVLQCSSNPDIAVFGLDGLKSSINSDPLNTIDFYESLADATDDINELPGIYANTSNPQTIYAKVKSSGTDCYSIIDFDLIVTPIPDASVDVSSTAICESEAVTFTITGTPNATILYNLDGGTTESILLGASGLATLTQSPASDMTINLEDAQILNDSGIVVCAQSLSDSETVTVSSNTTPIIVNNAPICEGEDGELVISGDPNATITYAINNGALQTLTLDTTGNFTLVLPTLTTTTNVEIISVTSGVIPNCVQTLNTIETLTVNPLPTVIAPSPLLVCNDGINPNSASFDLDAESAAISNFETNVSVTYYETQALAEAGNPLTALLSPYDSTSANQTVYVRVETDLGCVDYTTLSLEVVGAPIANTVPALQSCDANSQGFGTFDLTQAEAAIIAGNTQPVQVSYYLSEADAEAGTPEITDPTFFQNTDAYNQTIYVRVDTDGTDCCNISDLSLEVFDTPTVNTLQPFEVCDDVVNDGFTQFDLESQTPLLLGGATDVTVTYYESEADAEDGIDAIIGLYTNTNSTQTIFIRAENNFNVDCFEITTLTLIVNPLPTTITPTPLQVCDDGAPDGLTEIDLSLKTSEITGGNPNYVVNYYLNLSDAESETNPLPTLYTNTSNGQVITARVENSNTGCVNYTTLELIVEQAPFANSPTALVYCDPDSDGFGEFDLSAKDDEITAGDATLTVSYHETFADAENNVNPVSNSYNNIVENAQILYARVESSTIATACETIVPLELIVNPTPQLGATPPTPLEICDDSSADGFGQFNLTNKTSEILQDLADPTLYNVAFYTLETDAEDGLNPITNVANYTNSVPFNQVVWVRVEDNVSGCHKLTTLELIVNALPVLEQANPLVRCDTNNPGDEIEAFTLEEASDDILNGQSGIGLTFFETQLDADNDTNPLSSPYSNIANPQTIIVKATNFTTGCTTTGLLTLRVSPLPSPTAPEDLEVCDDDTDGFTSFNLDERTTEIIGGEQDVVITYHETLEDANTGSNAFSSPYTNIVMGEQTLYIRATNSITGCYEASKTLTLRVLETPEVPVSMTEYIICDSNSDGFAQFDLTSKDLEVIGAQSNVSLTYHVSETDALTGNNPISTPESFTNTSNPQTIFVRLENDNNECFDTGIFEISVALPPEAIQPLPLEICDDENADEITVFNLREKDDEITGGEAGWSVQYYETLANAEAQIDTVNAEAYTNVSVLGAEANPQTLFAVVTDTDTGCVDFTTLTIRVMPNPTPTPSDLLPNIELCDDFNTGDEVEVFDLTENEALILNGEAGVTASYYESLEDANTATNAIPDPTQYTNTELSEQEIYVRVTNDLTDCYALVDFTIIVHPLPEVIAVTDFIQCELFTDGFDSFDLTSKDGEVLNGEDPTQFVVSYHDNLADAEAGINGLVSPYTNISNPQQIFVTITNTVTGCSISTQSFNIEVQEAAQANPNMDPIVYETCDDNMETDGNPSNDSAQFDLTTRDIEVLDGQDAANYVVSYYETQEEADLKVNPLPTLYENIVNPQIIYARVDNDTPDGTGVDTSICYAVAALTLQVNPLPEFNLEDSYTLCLNTNGSEVLDPLVIDTGLSATDYSFEWSYEGTIIAGATGPSIMPSQGGSYSVLVTDMSTSTETNCTNMDITTVIESAPPSLSVELLTQAFADNHVLEAVATGIGVYEYSLDGGPWQDEGVFTNVSTGEHEITARDKNGCGITTESIFVIDYPLYFTPNGDGTNDTWNIEGIGSNAIIYIFDRYGKLLKQLSPDGEGWNGTFNGNALPTSDYWFTVEYDEPSSGVRKEFKANFTLKR